MRLAGLRLTRLTWLLCACLTHESVRPPWPGQQHASVDPAQWPPPGWLHAPGRYPTPSDTQGGHPGSPQLWTTSGQGPPPPLPPGMYPPQGHPPYPPGFPSQPSQYAWAQQQSGLAVPPSAPLYSTTGATPPTGQPPPGFTPPDHQQLQPQLTAAASEPEPPPAREARELQPRVRDPQARDLAHRMASQPPPRTPRPNPLPRTRCTWMRAPPSRGRQDHD